MKKENDQEEQESPEVSRRNLLKGCGVALLTTASYTIISVLSNATDAHAQVPEPPPPTCVQGFK